MSQEEREVWDGYFAAAITGLLAKPAQANPNAPSGMLAGMASNTKAITDKAARIADEMLEERRSR
ncbi:MULTISPECIES: hypothetical protein [Pseudomonas syringae group]|uniref:hypothetical protein n=1 Tax=Pseudomonas syringae group TaxID=136849 RepID=UPI000EFDF7F5|nr:MULTISPECIES: hypothetical protein [Pseudomonas syringae group]MCF9000476.1 hypothetical protein [Pseudomonas syringae]MCK0547924.1 hypothetical protein [Pseudomonas syringae pv. aptata]RMS14521.1 hypothetical protein ALP72_02130 [Pseudomonas coronafaciens pv. coronafaciens]UZS65570.1 hypothetical protein OQB65_14325 [Pseudomonas syringae]